MPFPQTNAGKVLGDSLLDWLTDYTFSGWNKFARHSLCQCYRRCVFTSLYRHGTTSAMVYSSVHKALPDALFPAASNTICFSWPARFCMDRKLPALFARQGKSAQQDSAEFDYIVGHVKGVHTMLSTPRFAPTSTGATFSSLRRTRSSNNPSVVSFKPLSEKS